MSPLHRKYVGLSFLFVIFAFVTPGYAWGPDGHIFINRVAAQRLPSSMPAFTKSEIPLFEYLANEPDRWVGPTLSPAQSPDHYIDMERVRFLKEFPKGRFEFIRALYKEHYRLLLADQPREAEDELPERVGLQPYAANEVYERLVDAFREYRLAQTEKRSTASVEKAALFYMGWLGHYVGDAANPLHTTVNYNGWVEKNPQGFTTDPKTHFKFEAQFVRDNLTPKNFEDLVKPPTTIQDVFGDYQGYLKSSFALVVPLYEMEKAGGFNGEGTAEGRAFAARRLAAGAQKLVDLWYTAWLVSAEIPVRPPRQ